MREILNIVAHLKGVFDKYAGKDGDPTSLSKSELSDILKPEAKEGTPKNKAELDEFFAVLDADQDGVINFTEFATFVASLAMLLEQCTP